MITENQVGNSMEAVAFALMKEIAGKETKALKEKTEDPRKYYLDLYRECLSAVYQYSDGEQPDDPVED